MNKIYKKALFIFRRDLRLVDNTALNAAREQAEVVIPIFNFDPIQVDKDNQYRSMNGLQFMVESLKELGDNLRTKNGQLYLFYSSMQKNIEHIVKEENIDAIFVNWDYTPFSSSRDKDLEKLCARYKIAFNRYHDELLIGDPKSILTGSKTSYTVYTPFLNKASKCEIAKPEKLAAGKFFNGKIKNAESEDIYKKIINKDNPEIKVHGGRSNALKILNNIKKFKDYDKERNLPALDATTHLSAAHKFGTISIRESYYAIKDNLGVNTSLLKELYWRDFFTYVAYHFPYVFGKPFRQKYANLKWNMSKKDFELWCSGNTGFPIVDAGIRQLNSTGWMHNRVRMVVASFLIKDLHINWLWGEKYFAQQLVDYDPAVNNGNWQWSASTGCDAQPYFRIFNPWEQQKKFDPDCVYIKKWIPELKSLTSKQIHNWFKNDENAVEYSKPMVDHSEEREVALALYKRV